MVKKSSKKKKEKLVFAVTCHTPAGDPSVIRITLPPVSEDPFVLTAQAENAADLLGFKQPMVVFPEWSPEYQEVFKGCNPTTYTRSRALVCGRLAGTGESAMVAATVALFTADTSFDVRRRFERSAKACSLNGPYTVFELPSRGEEADDVEKAASALFDALKSLRVRALVGEP